MTENHAQTVAELATKVAAALPFDIIELHDGRMLAVSKDERGGTHYADITLPENRTMPLPPYVTQHVKMQTSLSLVDYLNRFKNPDTLLFADIKNDSIRAVIDYHVAPKANVINASHDVGSPPPSYSYDVGDPTPSHGYDIDARLSAHTATLVLPLSLEWKTWTGKDGMLMGHIEFASFLEENSIDIVDPPGADLLDICRDLQGTRNVKFGSSVRHGDFEKIEYSKDNTASTRGDVQLPNSFTLSIPVYFGESNVSLTAFLRRNVDSEGVLRLGYKLSRVENTRQAEFHSVVSDIAEATSVAALYGNDR